MKNKIIICFAIVFAVSLFSTTSVFSQDAASTPDLQTIIAQLQNQIKELQAQITGLKTELEMVKAEIAFTASLKRGDIGEEVKKLQEFLKQNPNIYPEGLVTGYYGPLTEAAVKRLQEIYNIESAGIVGPKTLAKINELVSSGAGASGVIPPGLLTAPGIEKKLEATTSTVPVATSTTTPAGAIPAVPATPAVPAQPSTGTTTPAIPATPAVPAVPAITPVTPPSPSPSNTATTTVTTETTSCSSLNLTFQNNKTTFVVGEEYANYTCTCTPGGYVSYIEMQLVKSDGTAIMGYTTEGRFSAETSRFGIDNLPAGNYIFRACFSPGCASITASVPFTIVTSATPTEISTTSSSVPVLAPPADFFIDKLSNGPDAQPPKVGYAVRFNYTISPGQSFNIYIEKPSDADFVKYNQTSTYWSYLSDNLELGEHKFYVTVVNAAGIEGSPTPTKSISIYQSPMISSPASGATVSLPFQINLINNAPNVSGQHFAVYVFWPGGFWSTDSSNLSIPYGGPALDPNNNPHRVVVHSYDWNIFPGHFANTVLNYFNVATATTTSVVPPYNYNLASIIDSLTKILKLLEQLK